MRIFEELDKVCTEVTKEEIRELERRDHVSARPGYYWRAISSNRMLRTLLATDKVKEVNRLDNLQLLEELVKEIKATTEKAYLPCGDTLREHLETQDKAFNYIHPRFMVILETLIPDLRVEFANLRSTLDRAKMGLY